jgi:hypothetical protein
MLIVAASDLGDSGIYVVFVLFAWAVVVMLSAGGVLCGAQLLCRKASRAKKVAGGALLLVSCIVPIFCYYAPPYVVRLKYGSYPLGSQPRHRIKEGMSNCEVMTILGQPQQHFKEASDRETWVYWIDSYGAHKFAVDFGPDERVTNTYGN